LGRNNEIALLLRKHFGDQDFSTGKPRRCRKDEFICCHRCSDECNVRDRKEPIWTPRFGDENTDVMIVAEAPSSAGGPGLHVGGLLSECPKDAKSPLYKLRDFVKENYKTTPYFTNLVKCGVARQERRVKYKLETRVNKCVEALLLEEIRIMQPKIILCVGRLPYDYLKKHQSERVPKAKRIKLRQLTHYSRQAGLHLDIEDKVKFIWRCEARLPRSAKVSLSELSHFKSKRTKR
jgi:uracil-DNA glycosylase